MIGWRTVEVIRARQAPVPSGDSPRTRAIPVRALPATRGTITLRASYAGEVAPSARVDVFPRIGGVVAEILVQEGDQVRKGQIVARLDPKELRFQVEQARAAANTQRVQVEQARATVRAQGLQVEQARAALATQQARVAQLLAGTPPEQVRQAEEQVRQARASLEYSRQQLKRTEDLYAQGFVAGQAVEAARLDVELQEARLRSAEEQLSLLRRGPRPEEVEVARRQVGQAEVALRQAEQQAAQATVGLRQAQSQLAQVEVTLRQAQTLLAESTIHAPATGTVGRRLVDPGATVTPSTQILQLVAVDPVLITIPVAERESAFIRPGARATIRVDAVPGRVFQGTVTTLSPLLATATRTAEVKVEVPNPEKALRPGMTARVELVLVNRVNVVTVPVDAVLEQDGDRRLFVVRQGTAQARDVEIGASDGQRVEIVRGVAAGELVVVSGQLNLRDGAAVTIPGPGGSGRGRPTPTPGGQRP